MNIDKYLGIVTNRLSFNYIAFQAVTLFCVIFAATLGTSQFLLLSKHDVVSLLYAFSIITSFYLVIFLLVTCVEFIYFFCKKQLPQKLFNKSLVLFHTLFTYVFYSILMFNCPDSDVLHSYGGDYLLFIFLILLCFAIIAFTVTPVVLGVILELLKDIDIPPMQYMKNIWGFIGTVSATLIYIYLIIRFFLFCSGK